MNKTSDAPSKPDAKGHGYPGWAPRFWHGMPFQNWIPLLARNGFRIHPFRAPTAFAITGFSMFNTVMGAIQSLIHGSKVNATEVQEPVFIVGHWRSGTTYLHELMVLDDRFGYPTTYQCFAPSHFLLSEGMMTRYGNFLIPKKRPMDNMESGWNRPQEDEFALFQMGARSPYVRMAFPNTARDLESLDMEGLSPEDLKRWKDTLVQFMKLVTYHTGKRLILKSPPHTGRIATIYELFPDAKFVHIVRNPYVVFPSTRRVWRRLDDIQGLQRPHFRELDDYICAAFKRMYSGFEQQRASIPEDRIVDIRYEDLVEDPIPELQRIYKSLDLADFEPMRANLEAHFANQDEYKTNEYTIDEDVRKLVEENMSEFVERYGY